MDSSKIILVWVLYVSQPINEKGMKVDKNITKRLSHAAFVTNVLDGGRVLPLLSINKEIDKYIYSIELPGVNPDDFIVEISNGALLLFQSSYGSRKI